MDQSINLSITQSMQCVNEKKTATPPVAPNPRPAVQSGWFIIIRPSALQARASPAGPSASPPPCALLPARQHHSPCDADPPARRHSKPSQSDILLEQAPGAHRGGVGGTGQPAFVVASASHPALRPPGCLLRSTCLAASSRRAFVLPCLVPPFRMATIAASLAVAAARCSKTARPDRSA